MINFRTRFDEDTNETIVEMPLTGRELIDCPMFNKSSSFTEEERHELGLLGLLPPHISTVEEQLERTYENYKRKDSDIERYIFLTSLQERNETLFYMLLNEHITEMMPIIYTPVVGQACQSYSHIYRRPRGLFVSYPGRELMDTILDNADYPDVEVIVVTDGERILGLGDQGVGGMGIPIGKLSLYTLCAGIHPAATLPVFLDVGTDNHSLMNDRLYMGWHHSRIRGKDYDDFVDCFVQGVKRRFPNALLQWEDFAKGNAARLLERYRDELCTFNDDIQGTGSVTLAGLLAATDAIGSKIGEQRIVILGAGSAAIGISDQIVAAAISEGVSENEAGAQIWLVDSRGLVSTGRNNLEPGKQKYAQTPDKLAGWKLERPDFISLADAVKNVRPTILIGTGAQPGAFTEDLVREMASGTKRPIIFPLSNPTSKCEAQPINIIKWTLGKALVATGSPFTNVDFEGRSIRIGQCNNAFIFPGVGLGIVAAKARRVTDSMFVVAARALSKLAPSRKDPSAPLYPVLEDVRKASFDVAVAVANEAKRLGLADIVPTDGYEKIITEKMWKPAYPRLKLLKK